MTESSPQHFGKYTLTRRIGEGGMGTLHLGAIEGPSGFSKPCAVKRIRPVFSDDPDFRSMLAKEARVAALLHHPNIVQVFDFGEVEGENYLTMEYVEGASLSVLLRQARDEGAPLGWRAVVVLGMALADALDYIHGGVEIGGQRTPLVHRDISPGNVLVSIRGTIKLTDFGLVKVARAPRVTDAGVVKGKYGYMSPEQVKAQPLDGRSDVFALGVVLWEVLTGRPLFKRADVAATIAAVLAGRIPRLEDVAPDAPAEMQAIFHRMLAPDRSRRYGSARELHDALATFATADQLAQTRRDLARRAALAANGSGSPPVESSYASVSALAELQQAEADDGLFVWVAIVTTVLIASGMLWFVVLR